MRGRVCNEGPSPMLIRTAGQRIMGINNVLASSPNDSQAEILTGGSHLAVRLHKAESADTLEITAIAF